MKLHDALKSAVSSQGVSVLKDIRLGNILSDYKAYEEFPATKFILTTFIKEGLMPSFMKALHADKAKDVTLQTYVKNAVNAYGFNASLTQLVLESVAYALNAIDAVSSCIPSQEALVPAKQYGVHRLPLGTIPTFMGMPVQGDVTTFVEKLKKKGLKPLKSKRRGEVELRGDFAGLENCEFFIGYTAITSQVCNVEVIYKEHSCMWDDVYKIMKDCLSHKYGEPTLCEEKFPNGMTEYDASLDFENSFMLKEDFVFSCNWEDEEEYLITDIYVVYPGEVRLFFRNLNNLDLREKEDIESRCKDF